MKKKHKSLSFFLILTSCFLILCGCSAKETDVTCPFTEITWENTLKEVQALEGEALESYPSIYQGTTYTYHKTYKDMEGTIKYMFDDEERLMGMAWLYIPESAQDLENVYNTLCEETEKLYGESGFDSNMGTAMGEVWYLEDGNIVISVMSTGVNEAIQYQFVHPEVSSEKPES